MSHVYKVLLECGMEVRKLVIIAACRSNLSASLYYSIVRHFDGEERAVLCGAVAYYRNSADSTLTSNVRLRRNVHRLEKGLCMRPRRAKFAEEYIGATVEAYERVHAACSLGEPNNELRWAHAVISTYFESVAHSPSIGHAYKRFQSLVLTEKSRAKCVPYLRVLSQDIGVTYDGLHNLALRRRSVRWFLPREVPRTLIDKALNIARYAPSACNRQPFEYRVFDQHELVRSLAQMPLGTSGWGHNIPVIIAVVGSLSSFFSERDRHVIYIDASLSAMLLLQALETLGLSSCVINWGDNRSRDARISSLLNLRCDQRVIMLIALGFPDPEGLVPYSSKKELAHIRSYNREDR